MPSLTEIDWNDEKNGFSIPTKSGNPHHLPINHNSGSGAVTFNETEEKYGRAGNHSIMIDETGTKKWEELGVKDFVGNKSYHFFKDKVVALGSDYQATTDRKMKTVLIQDLVYDDIWNMRDYRRWNLDSSHVMANLTKTKEAGNLTSTRPTSSSTTVTLGSFGGQQGTWSSIERTKPFSFRVSTQGAEALPNSTPRK